MSTNLPLICGGSSIPPEVSGTFLEWGKFPLGTLLRTVEEAIPFESLFREAFSAWAAATREKWSLALIRSDETVGASKRREASGSFSTKVRDEWGLFSSCWFDEDPDLVLHIKKNIHIETRGQWWSRKVKF